jgi:hypothetical protein
MTVAQLLKVLEAMPRDAVVMIEGDAGIARVGGVDRHAGSFGMPDEILLLPYMTE